MKFKRVLSGVILSAICVSMTGCKGGVDTDDPTYRLVGKLFDKDLPCYLDESVFKINKDFDDLLEEDSEMYDKYIERERSSVVEAFTHYYLKTDAIDLFGGIVSFPESCVLDSAELGTISNDNDILYQIDFEINYEKYIEEKNMDISEEQEFFHDICNQFVDTIVCDYKEETNYRDAEKVGTDRWGEYLELETEFCKVKLSMDYHYNVINIKINRILENT
ncbi:MAG: hypothetical protein PUA84_06295 [Oscillospiraceae bacterium]|nr:hypothetical protein [Oscillospiraceae bacterium]